MTPSQIVLALHTLVAIRRPVFIWGAPGVGKSRVVASVAEDLGMALRDVRAVLIDPVDLRGIPRISSDGRTVWCPPDFLPGPSDPERGILFLDELNAAPPLVQAACYQLILDRRVGEYRLPDGWAIVAAGNREGDRAVTHRMPTALANRMVHLDFDVSLDDWLDWAERSGIRPEISAFLRFRPGLLHDFDAKSASRSFPTPRTWEFVSDILKAQPPGDVEYDLLRGTIGDGAAAELAGFLAVWRSLPTVDETLANPLGVRLPEEPAAIYALCDAVSRKATADDAEALALLASRLHAEFGVLLMRNVACRDERLEYTEAFQEWARANAQVLL